MKCAVVTPIGHEEWLDGLVIILAARAMNSQRTCKSVCVLKTVMAMVPGRSVLCSMELVCEIMPRGNWALGDTVHTIHGHVIEHTDPMPVNRCTVIFEIINDRDLKDITPAGFDPGTWVGVIEDFSFSFIITIGVDPLIRHVECILGVMLAKNSNKPNGILTFLVIPIGHFLS